VGEEPSGGPGQDAINFISGLRLNEGRWAGEPIRLMKWQSELIQEAFGTLRPDGRRQYHYVYCEAPKKSGKTPLSSAIICKLLYSDGEPGAQVFSAAGDRDQASIAFRHAAGMVEQTPPLNEISTVLRSQKKIEVPHTNSFYEALSSEDYTKHGKNISGLICDEMHAWPNRAMWDVLTVGTGITRRQQLIVVITTAGWDLNSIGGILHKRAMQAIADPESDPTFLAKIWAAGEDDDWNDEAVWKKANPALDYLFGIEDIREEYQQALRSPSDENNFRRFRLNQWVKQETRWIQMAEWDACAGPLEASPLERRACYAGLDLASTRDITAMVLVFPPSGSEPHRIIPHFWIPLDTIRERTQRDHVPYYDWAERGLVHTTPGNVVDYEKMKADIIGLSRKYDLREIAYDRLFQGADLAQQLEREGIVMVPFGQGFMSMAGPSKELEKIILRRGIWHGGNPVMRWMADNVVVKIDPAGNIKPDKARSTEKIDGIVALIMGLDRAIRNGGGGESYSFEVL
jgi:phage terminase large subunit-like protein